MRNQGKLYRSQFLLNHQNTIKLNHIRLDYKGKQIKLRFPKISTIFYTVSKIIIINHFFLTQFYGGYARIHLVLRQCLQTSMKYSEKSIFPKQYSLALMPKRLKIRKVQINMIGNFVKYEEFFDLRSIIGKFYYDPVAVQSFGQDFIKIIKFQFQLLFPISIKLYLLNLFVFHQKKQIHQVSIKSTIFSLSTYIYKPFILSIQTFQSSDMTKKIEQVRNRFGQQILLQRDVLKPIRCQFQAKIRNLIQKQFQMLRNRKQTFPKHLSFMIFLLLFFENLPKDLKGKVEEMEKANPPGKKTFCLNQIQTMFNIIKFFNLQEKQWRKMHGELKVEGTKRQLKLHKKIKHQSSESDQFQLQYHQIKKLGLPINKKKLKIGNWVPQQNLIYLNFLQQHKLDFVSEQQRRKNKVFYRLSKILKKRTPDQCRSHHQKLQMKYEDNIDEIIQSIKRKLTKKSPELFDQESKKFDISTKKTGVTESTEDKQQEPILMEEGSFYKLFKNRQNEFSLHISFDQIQQWS